MSSTASWAGHSLVDLLSTRAERHPERVALRFIHVHGAGGPDIILNYGQLHERARRLAARLTLYAERGDRALLLLPSGPEYVTALFACFYSGIIAVPAYPFQSLQPRHTERITAIARDAKPSLLLTETVLRKRLTSGLGSLPALQTVKLIATDAEDDDAEQVGFYPVDADSHDVALLQYTSGSTSSPKGVKLSHQNLMSNEAAIHHAFSIQRDDVIVSWLPLFHDMGLIGTLLQPIFAGVSAVIMAPQRFMEHPRRWLDSIARYGGTVSGAPDFAYRLCTERVSLGDGETLDLSSWRLAFCGAEPVRARTLRAFADKFAANGFDSKALYPCYGLAESTLIVSGGERGTSISTQVFCGSELRQHRAIPAVEGETLVSCGKPHISYDLVIADPETGESLPEGRIGEIQVSGPSVSLGYWENPPATQQTFVEREGSTFLRTGDLGFLFHGDLYVTGRRKDLIIVRGQNLYPQDIERSVEAENPVIRSGRVVAFEIEFAGVSGIAVIAEVNPRMKKLIEPLNVCEEITLVVAHTYGESPNLVLLLEPGEVQLTSSGKLRRSACKQAWLESRLNVLAAYGPAAISGAPLPDKQETSPVQDQN